MSSQPAPQGHVLVVGSANLDLVATTARHPAPGETLIGRDYAEHPGGKGLNQAVAAARAGATTRFVGAVGRDDAGRTLADIASTSGVETSQLLTVDAPTGRALILVADSGENSIVVVPGANDLCPPGIPQAGDVVLAQLEVPLSSGYIIDSIAFDLLHGGNRQSIMSGVYYYGFDAESTAIPNEIPQTTAAYNFIKAIVGDIITGTPISPKYQNVVSQVTNLEPASEAESISLRNNLELITSIINSGPSVAPDREPISLVASSDTNVQRAFALLMANRNFIQAEVIAFVNNEFSGFEYNQQKCRRDVGLIIDALKADILTGGNFRAVEAAKTYYSKEGTYHIVTLEDNVRDQLLFVDGSTVNFYQRSYMSASGYLFEYCGAGTNYGALPQVGRVDPNQSKEVVQLNNGKVFFTSTDQNGDFRIGPGLVISQATGVLSGRTFEKSLFAQMTPFILAVEAGGSE